GDEAALRHNPLWSRRVSERGAEASLPSSAGSVSFFRDRLLFLANTERRKVSFAHCKNSLPHPQASFSRDTPVRPRRCPDVCFALCWSDVAWYRERPSWTRKRKLRK